jgi:hypothetical protein
MEVENMSIELTQAELTATIREVLKDHQREGLNMIGNVDQLAHRLVDAVHDLASKTRAQERKSA